MRGGGGVRRKPGSSSSKVVFAERAAIDALHKDASLSAGGVLRAAAEHVPGAVLDAAPGERVVLPRVREAA